MGTRFPLSWANARRMSRANEFQFSIRGFAPAEVNLFLDAQRRCRRKAYLFLLIYFRYNVMIHAIFTGAASAHYEESGSRIST